MSTGRWEGEEDREGTVLELAFGLCSLTLSLWVLLRVSWQLSSLCSADSQSRPWTWPASGIESHILSPEQRGAGTRVWNSL